jgi:hypothetical protein
MTHTKTNLLCDAPMPLPLLMAYTPSTCIQTDENPTTLIYDPISQSIKGYEMRTIGTKCVTRSATKKKSGSTGYVTASDSKNAIDDSKSVK